MDADNRRYVYDSAKAAFQHASQRAAGQAKGRGQIDREHRIPVRILHTDEQTVASDAGVVDEDVDRSERAFNGRDQGINRRSVGEVARRRMRTGLECGRQRF